MRLPSFVSEAAAQSAGAGAFREAMVEDQLAAIGDARVREVMASVPRHIFAPGAPLHDAYHDCALPIGYGQTMAPPFMVATMLDAAELAGDERVLEVGTGAGYQAALLALLARSVCTIERIPELARLAAENLWRVGLTRVTVIAGDGARGVPARAPYDVIVVAATTRRIPIELVRQLADGGRLIVPVTGTWGGVLQRVRKTDNKLTIERLSGCELAPLVEELS